ncbi:AIG2-like protein [Jackrogersella minutella]|nr:AIG2-like protein [Jackrogersella minutella]
MTTQEDQAVDEASHSLPEPVEGKPRPIFLYGTLCAMPLLAVVLTGSSLNTDAVAPLTQPARVHGHARFSVRDRDYPAAIAHEPESSIDGVLFTPETVEQRERVEGYISGSFTRSPVMVTLLDGNGNPRDETVDADISLWTGDRDQVLDSSWDLPTFVLNNLWAYIDIFEGEYQDMGCGNS